MSMETLTGTLKELGRRGGFYEYEVGGTKVATKKQDVAASVNSLIGQSVEMNAMKSQKTKDGVLYTNYYVVSAVPAEGAPPPQVGAGAPSSSQPAPTSPLPSSMHSGGATPSPHYLPVDDREDKIFRQVGLKVAAHFLPFLPEHERVPDSLIAIGERFVHYFRTGQ